VFTTTDPYPESVASWISSHLHTSYFLKIRFNIVLSQSQGLPVWFLWWNCICFSRLSHACYVSCPSHHPRFDNPYISSYFLSLTFKY
jgi:hypothetical protein